VLQEVLLVRRSHIRTMTLWVGPSSPHEIFPWCRFTRTLSPTLNCRSSGFFAGGTGKNVSKIDHDLASKVPSDRLEAVMKRTYLSEAQKRSRHDSRKAPTGHQPVTDCVSFRKIHCVTFQAYWTTLISRTTKRHHSTIFVRYPIRKPIDTSKQSSICLLSVVVGDAGHLQELTVDGPPTAKMAPDEPARYHRVPAGRTGAFS